MIHVGAGWVLGAMVAINVLVYCGDDVGINSRKSLNSTMIPLIMI